jgi:hypothetical protein
VDSKTTLAFPPKFGQRNAEIRVNLRRTKSEDANVNLRRKKSEDADVNLRRTKSEDDVAEL